MKFYKGKYKVKNKKKYEGDHTNVVYRSSWERAAFKWLDNHKGVIGWSSEQIIVPYRCKTDNKVHRYFPDLFIRMKDGKEYLIEIKPEKQTLPPKKPSRKTKRYLTEVMTYGKNQSKWEAAQAYANKHGLIFQVWTETVLRNLGMKIL
tara:strand:- start:808 stop:1251 length:444 start_codon:yes stop_codon:yes gene_type:complete